MYFAAVHQDRRRSVERRGKRSDHLIGGAVVEFSDESVGDRDLDALLQAAAELDGRVCGGRGSDGLVEFLAAQPVIEDVFDEPVDRRAGGAGVGDRIVGLDQAGQL